MHTGRVKFQPCLLLSSLCVLLCQPALSWGESVPPPRFGYGSATRSADAAPRKPTSRPASSEKLAPKPKPAKSTKATKPANAAPAKTAPKATAAKPPAAKKDGKPSAAPAKEIAAKSKPKPKASAPETKNKTSGIAKVAPKANREKSASAPAQSLTANTKPKPATPGKTSPSPQTAATKPAAAPPLHFFGLPIPLPDASTLPAPASQPARTPTLASAKTTAPSAAPAAPVTQDTSHSVDLTAARDALQHGRTLPPAPEATETNRPAGPPRIAPQPIGRTAFQASSAAPTPAAEAAAPMEEANTTPASATPLPPMAGTPEAAPEDAIPDEPFLTPPALAEAAPAAPTLEAAPDLTTNELLGVTEETLPAASESTLTAEASLPPEGTSDAEPATATDPDEAAANDLSERERAFVRSLAEAAASVTNGSGKLSTDFPQTIATAARLGQVPAETTASFRSTAAAPLPNSVPDLPMEMSSDLIPARPESLPERLPDFTAPATGKIDVQSDRQADYDQANNKVIFTGKVELNSASIRLRAEQVEIFMKPGGGGMERVEASGGVLMRTADTANGPGQMASAGHASYNLKTGEITLSDWPKIQEAGKSHLSTDPSTKMMLYTDGRLRTDGPNRTIMGGN